MTPRTQRASKEEQTEVCARADRLEPRPDEDAEASVVRRLNGPDLSANEKQAGQSRARTYAIQQSHYCTILGETFHGRHAL